MKNKQGFVWAPVLIIVATVVVAGVSGFLLFKAGNPKESENQNVVVNQANSNANTNIAINTNQVANTNSSANTNTAVNTNTASNTNTATNPTAGWKTYTNSTFGYSLMYPASWKSTEEFGMDSVQLLPQNIDKGYMGENDLAGAVTISTKAGGDEITDQKTVTINGLTAIQGKILGIVTFDATRFTNQEGREFVVRWSQNYSDTTRVQILSTFQFID